MTTKTPVSILQEMCIKTGRCPHYTLTVNGSGTHQCFFQYEVEVGDTKVTGEGRSKKEAKHDAARNMLTELKKGSVAAPESLVEEIKEVGEVMSPYKDKVSGNAVGALQQLCIDYSIQVPFYEVIRDEGPPHAKLFTMQCRVSKLEEYATATTKKQAKQLVAQKMIDLLKTSVGDAFIAASESQKTEGKMAEDTNADAAMAKYNEIGSLGTSRPRTVFGEKIADYHLLLKSLKSDLLEDIKANKKASLNLLQEDPVGLLDQILKELNVEKHTETIVTNSNACQESTYSVILGMNTVPDSGVFGTGCTEELALAEAAKRAVEYLKLLNM